MIRSEIYALIDAEREAQIRKWAVATHGWGIGDCSSRDMAAIVKVGVLAEEVGEVARAVLDQEGEERTARELIQVAAVAVAWLESIGSVIEEGELAP